MKLTLKKWMLALVCAFTLGFAAHADNEKPIQIGQLPAAAQQLVKKHFSNHKVALAKVETGLISKEYNVIFTNGDHLEFDRNGQWTEISCKRTAVPPALVPAAIARYLRTNYPNQTVIKLERGRADYEVELATGVEITFNTKFQVIDIDN